MTDPEPDASAFHVAAGLILLLFFLLVVLVVGAWAVTQIWSPPLNRQIPPGGRTPAATANALGSTAT